MLPGMLKGGEDWKGDRRDPVLEAKLMQKQQQHCLHSRPEKYFCVCLFVEQGTFYSRRRQRYKKNLTVFIRLFSFPLQSWARQKRTTHKKNKLCGRRTHLIKVPLKVPYFGGDAG